MKVNGVDHVRENVASEPQPREIQKDAFGFPKKPADPRKMADPRLRRPNAAAAAPVLVARAVAPVFNNPPQHATQHIPAVAPSPQQTSAMMRDLHTPSPLPVGHAGFSDHPPHHNFNHIEQHHVEQHRPVVTHNHEGRIGDHGMVVYNNGAPPHQPPPAIGMQHLPGVNNGMMPPLVHNVSMSAPHCNGSIHQGPPPMHHSFNGVHMEQPVVVQQPYFHHQQNQHQQGIPHQMHEPPPAAQVDNAPQFVMHSEVRMLIPNGGEMVIDRQQFALGQQHVHEEARVLPIQQAAAEDGESINRAYAAQTHIISRPPNARPWGWVDGHMSVNDVVVRCGNRTDIPEDLLQVTVCWSVYDIGGLGMLQLLCTRPVEEVRLALALYDPTKAYSTLLPTDMRMTISPAKSPTSTHNDVDNQALQWFARVIISTGLPPACSLESAAEAIGLVVGDTDLPGGRWAPELEVGDPSVDVSVLVGTAIRTSADYGLDLSQCATWVTFCVVERDACSTVFFLVDGSQVGVADRRRKTKHCIRQSSVLAVSPDSGLGDSSFTFETKLLAALLLDMIAAAMAGAIFDYVMVNEGESENAAGEFSSLKDGQEDQQVEAKAEAKELARAATAFFGGGLTAQEIAFLALQMSGSCDMPHISKSMSTQVGQELAPRVAAFGEPRLEQLPCWSGMLIPYS